MLLDTLSVLIVLVRLLSISYQNFSSLCVSFISFLIALFETFSITLKKSSEKRHLCLILDIRGKGSTFPHEYNTDHWFVIYRLDLLIYDSSMSSLFKIFLGMNVAFYKISFHCLLG